jgi:hypothetical protein
MDREKIREWLHSILDKMHDDDSESATGDIYLIFAELDKPDENTRLWTEGGHTCAE